MYANHEKVPYVVWCNTGKHSSSNLDTFHPSRHLIEKALILHFVLI